MLRKATIIEHKTYPVFLSSQKKKKKSQANVQYLLSLHFVMSLEEPHINALMTSQPLYEVDCVYVYIYIHSYFAFNLCSPP